jgi:hypothetical protein
MLLLLLLLLLAVILVLVLALLDAGAGSQQFQWRLLRRTSQVAPQHKQIARVHHYCLCRCKQPSRPPSKILVDE